MNHCRNCGALVPAEKAWCPQCNEPVEAEARRTVEREMDSFAGTLIRKPKPRPAGPTPVAPPPPTAAPPPPPATPSREPAPPRDPVTEANPAITTTGPMPALIDSGAPITAPPPIVPEPVKPGRSRLVTFIAIGLVLGVVLLLIMIVAGIVLWNYSR